MFYPQAAAEMPTWSCSWPQGFTCQILYLQFSPKASSFQPVLTCCISHTFSSSSISRSVHVFYSLSVYFFLYVWATVSIRHSVICACVLYMWSASQKRQCQTLRHGPGLIHIQAHSMGLRLGDNCCTEEWIAWELSSSTGASHQAVHHMGLTTDSLRRNKGY